MSGFFKSPRLTDETLNCHLQITNNQDNSTPHGRPEGSQFLDLTVCNSCQVIFGMESGVAGYD